MRVNGELGVPGRAGAVELGSGTTPLIAAERVVPVGDGIAELFGVVYLFDGGSFLASFTRDRTDGTVLGLGGRVRVMDVVPVGYPGCGAATKVV